MVRLKGVKPKKDVCFYHLCREKAPLIQCKYCGEYFCKQHLRPKPVGGPRFKGITAADDLYMDEWHKNDGHPCANFTNIWAEQEKKRKETETTDYLAALDILKNKEKRHTEKIEYIPMRKPENTQKEKWVEESTEEYKKPIYEPPKAQELLKKHPKEEKKILGWILLFIIIALVIGGIVAFKHYQVEARKNANLPKCMDGTFYDECSKDKPYYCYDGELVKKAATCDCPEGYKVDFQDCKKGNNSINISLPQNRDKTLNNSSFYNSLKNFFTKTFNTFKGILSWIFLGAVIILFGMGTIFPTTLKTKIISWIILLILFAVTYTLPITEINDILESGSNNLPSLSSPLKQEIDINQLETDIHNLINQERLNKGLRALSWDDKLSGIAETHSLDMAQNGFFSHDNLRGQDPTARADAAGYSCYKDYGSYYTGGIAENIMQNNLYDSITYINGIPIHDWNSQLEIATSTVQGWMNSPGHRENILTSTYDREGIGVAISSDDKVYITEDFC